MSDERFGNQTGIIRTESLQKNFTIIGAGAIGSFLTMILAKMGARSIQVYDDDMLEESNIANQLYPEHLIGTSKVEALTQVVKHYSGVDLKALNSRWTPNVESNHISDIVISCVDDMDVRKQIWDRYKDNCVLLVDGRMGAQVMKVYTVDTTKPAQVEAYENSLHSTAEAEPERCTARTVIFTVALVAGFMLNNIKKYLNNEKYPTILIYDCVNDIHIKTYK